MSADPIAGEPTNGCMLAAINERAVLRAKNYMQPNVEAHLLAIWFQDSRHVALVVKGDHHWFAWDDAYGGRPLFSQRREAAAQPDDRRASRVSAQERGTGLVGGLRGKMGGGRF